MLDKNRIISRMSMFGHYKKNIGRIIPSSLQEYKRSSPEVKAATERYLQVMSELELDVIVLLYKGLELKPVGSEESVISSLEQSLGVRIIERVRARRRIRNALVHAYSDIDDADVFGMASNLRDVEEFENAVKKLIK